MNASALDPLLDTPPAQMVEFVRRKSRDVADPFATNGRTQTRFPLVDTILVQPVDRNLRAIGEPFQAVSRNVSRSGLALVHRRAVTEPYLLVELTRPRSLDSIRLVLAVVRCQPFGPFYDVGGRLVGRLDKPSGLSRPTSATVSVAADPAWEPPQPQASTSRTFHGQPIVEPASDQQLKQKLAQLQQLQTRLQAAIRAIENRLRQNVVPPENQRGAA